MLTWWPLAAALVTAAAGLLSALLYQRTAYPWFWDDLLYYARVRTVGRAVRTRMQRGVITYLDCFIHQARKTPDKAFIVYEDRSLSYGEADRRSGLFARVFQEEAGVASGDVVALLMCNEPDFVCAWLGLCKLGAQAAFLNYNLKPRALLHCLASCGATRLVAGADVVQGVVEVLSELQQQQVEVWVVDHAPPCSGVNTLLDKLERVSQSDDEPCAAPPPNVDVMSNFLFIFTSGTTGVSKATRVGHFKAIMSMSFLQLCGARSSDVIYITLPLYHMSASLLGIGGCIQLGATCVLKKKFSAGQFWKDCMKHEVTVFLYIGELCRYLINQPTTLEERAHKVRVAAGSGLRADVWREFTRRFGRIGVREGYGLTEASIGFLNYTDEVGPIGRAGYFNKLNMPFELLRCDAETYEPIRTDTGRCVRCQRGETGLLVAPLSATNQFLGYAGNKTQSEKKLLRDVFHHGDVYFNTGDLMLHDHRDFLYFRDRIGDTFRWKGENVSTTEVSEALSSVDFIQETNVYGVTVPGYEGRAGMAAVVLKADHKLDGVKLHQHLVRTLPAYSWPWFLRIQESLDVTETYKQRKQTLVQEGFDPDSVHSPLYFLDASRKDYVSLTPSVYHDIINGQVKL